MTTGRELTEVALAAGRGDPAAQTEFVRRTQADVWRACAALASPAEADDLTQETFLRALPALARFRAEASARTWLVSIARRVVADHIRRTVRQRRRDERAAARRLDAPAPDHVELDHLVAALDDDRREAFVLTQLVGLSYAEAAEVIGCPIGTVRSRVSRGREDLISWLADDEPGTTKPTGTTE